MPSLLTDFDNVSSEIDDKFIYTQRQKIVFFISFRTSGKKNVFFVFFPSFFSVFFLGGEHYCGEISEINKFNIPSSRFEQHLSPLSFLVKWAKGARRPRISLSSFSSLKVMTSGTSHLVDLSRCNSFCTRVTCSAIRRYLKKKSQIVSNCERTPYLPCSTESRKKT